MAPSCYDVAASMLLCAEEHSSILCFEEEEELEAVGRKRGRSPDYGDDFGVDLFPPQSEECVAGLVEKEPEHMPRADYGERLRGGGGDGVDLCVRREAIDWIWKVYTYYSFRPLTAYLAVNYLDRFLSRYELPEGKDWMTQLLSVACVSLAAKMEETAVPQSLDLQVGDVRYVFEAKTIQRMELLVLSTLNWRMQAVTPFSYMDYFLNKLNGGNAAPRSWLSQSAELILCAARGTCCIGFRPSEIAAAVAAAVVIEGNVAGIENACAHVDKADVAASTVADDSDDEEEYGEADDSDDEFDRLLLANLMQEEAAAAAAMYGMSAVAMHLDKYCNRSEFREVGPGLSGLEWVERKLGNPTACYKMFRMTPTMFYRLHDMLCNNYGLQSSEKSSSIEALGMFLWMVGAPQSVRQAEDRFERSLGTVHSFFYKVLNCLRRLADDIIKPRDPQFRTMHTRLDNPRFYPFFKDCIGAIDGTHIPCVVSKDLVVQYMCRKNITTQNVMACCDFDLIFTFVLAGWPGSVHDMRVFNDAMNKYTDVFPHPPPGKYYLVDSGYANRPGYLAPYRGTKYHLQEYQNAEEPQGKEELFNYAHSSLRNCIERSFGVLKQKWRILMHLPSYPIETQTHIIVACMALHNFIRLSGLRDRHFGRCDRDPRYVPSVASVDQPPTEQAPTILDSRQMNEFRDSIALQMLEGSL